MANIYKGTLGLIGNTPLVEVANIEKELGLEAKVLVKLVFQPGRKCKRQNRKGNDRRCREQRTVKGSFCDY